MQGTVSLVCNHQREILKYHGSNHIVYIPLDEKELELMGILANDVVWCWKIYVPTS